METKHSPGRSLKYMIIKNTTPIPGILKQSKWICFGAQISDTLTATKLRGCASPKSLMQKQSIGTWHNLHTLQPAGIPCSSCNRAKVLGWADKSREVVQQNSAPISHLGIAEDSEKTHYSVPKLTPTLLIIRC